MNRIDYACWIPGSLVGTQSGFAYIERIISWQPRQGNEPRLPERILVLMSSAPYEWKEFEYDRVRLYPLYLLTRKEIANIDKHGEFTSDQKDMIVRYMRTLPTGSSFKFAYARLRERVLTEPLRSERSEEPRREYLRP